MEPLLVSELSSLGVTGIQEERAGAFFLGTLETAYRVCLWSRIANRVLLPLKTFSASTPEKLYGGVKSIRWSDHLSSKNTLAVDYSFSQTRTTSEESRPKRSVLNSGISHTHFGALKTKDAIVDQLRSVQGARPSIDPIRPDVRVNVYVLNDQVTVSLDLSGESLHKRGYREQSQAAPLKENLAAAILISADWPKLSQEAGPKASLLDPMCGSGTLPIEAAWIAARVAPGLMRKHFGFLGWAGHDSRIWKLLVEEAEQTHIRDRKKLPNIVGYDQDFRAVRVALANLERAGLRGVVHIEKRELTFAEKISDRGIFVVNPPYGERLGEVEELKGLYKRIGDSMKQKFKGWDGYVFTGRSELAKSIGLRAARRHVLFNGAIECRLLKFELY